MGSKTSAEKSVYLEKRIAELESKTRDIENFYSELSLYDNINSNRYFFNKYKILYLINDMKNFNLDKKNLITSVTRILENEKK